MVFWYSYRSLILVLFSVLLDMLSLDVLTFTVLYSYTPEFLNPKGWRVGDKCHIEQSATPHTWWGPPLSICATSRYPHRVLFASVTRNAYGIELSATRSKVPHHTHGGGHLLVSVRATSRYSLPYLWLPTFLIQYLTRNNHNVKNVGYLVSPSFGYWYSYIRSK